jgi:class 3 adenylate cyclase
VSDDRSLSRTILHKAADALAPARSTLDMSGGSALSPEHRYLSVLFCDMVDSTGHVFSMEAEAYAALLSAYRRIVFERVRRHGGTVARVVGDGVLAYFGWPLASGRDALAAVACAREIAAATPRLDSPVTVAVRISIETGWVLVGDIGTGQGLDNAIEHGAAVGPTPHVAARLQALARLNGVIVGERTLQLLGGRFITEPADTTGIRLPVPVTAAHVIGETGGGDPLARLRVGELPPPVGRDVELAALRARWELASSGQGQVVLLSAEAGMGKTRLLTAFLDHIGTARGVVVLFCSAPGQDSPFQPVIETLRRALHVTADDDADSILAKATEFSVGLGLAGEAYATALAALLGVSPPDPPAPTAIRRHIHETLLALIDRLVRQRPQVIVVEDVHWADPSTLDFLQMLADWAQFTQLLLIVTYRSDHVLPWTDRAHVLRLALSPLSDDAAGRLATDLAAAAGLALDREPLTNIVTRAEGVPLFVEEFVRALSHQTGPAPRLPGSVAQLLTARLDSLGPARQLAQVAAVMGRDTPIALLKSMSDMTDDNFEDTVQRLTDTGLMTRRGAGETAMLEFRHALLADAAYEALPSDRRRALHSTVAEALRRLRPSLTNSEPEVLARHLAAADRSSEASALFRNAAANALSSAAFIEAETHARRALELAEDLRGPTGNETVVAALALLGEALIATHGYAHAEVQQVFERGARLALGMGTAREMLPVLRGLTSFYQVRGPLWLAHQLSERVLQIAKIVGEPLLLAQAERRHGWCRMCEGNLVVARQLLEDALARQMAVGDSVADRNFIFDDVTTLGTLAWLDWLTDGRDAALNRSAQTAVRAENCTRPLSAAYAFGFAAIAHQLAGDAEGVERLAARCGAIAAEHGLVYWTATAEALRGWSQAFGHHASDGVFRLRRAVADYHRTQSEILRPYLLGLQAEAEFLAGSGAAAREALDLAEEVTTTLDARLHLPTLLLLRGRLSEGAESMRALAAARDEARRQGAAALAIVAEAELARFR